MSIQPTIAIWRMPAIRRWPDRMDPLAFTLYAQPKGWQRAGQNGKFKFVPKDERAYRKLVAAAAKDAMGTRPPWGPQIPLKLEVLCVYTPPKSWTKAKLQACAEGRAWKTSTPDHDNLVKLISDTLNEIVFADDAQISVTSFAKRYGAPERTQVRITQLPGWMEYGVAEI